MKQNNLSDLHNPDNIVGIIHKNGDNYIPYVKQAFQEYLKSIELWEQLPDNRLRLVKRWHKKSIVFFQTD